MTNYFDDLYRQKEDYFSFEPVKLLEQNYHNLDKSRPVLDVGAGTGRNAIFLARQGFKIDAVEPSYVGVDIMRNKAEREELKINSYICGFADFSPQSGPYSGILLLGLLQLLSWDEIGLLMRKIRTWTSDGSLVFVTAWTTIDPAYERRKAELEAVGRNSFMNPDGNLTTYLEQNEILGLFEEFDIINHHEGLGPWHSHSCGTPERHGSVEAVFRR
jgi:cyclopropane fatty-acyl-phospholipid synthase-like methyltransferase